jgi:diguanylate cyclase (GGDEF)-like protein
VRSLSKRAVLGLLFVCGLFSAMIMVVGLVGISGVRSTAADSKRIAVDQLGTSTATARFGRVVDRSHVEGTALYLNNDPARAAQQDRTLYEVTLPAVESALSTLVQLHVGDPPAETAGIQLLVRQWAAVRILLRPLSATYPALGRDQQMDAAYRPLSAHIDNLLGTETVNAGKGEQRASNTAARTTKVVLGAVLLAVLIAVSISMLGIRAIRRSVRPENEQLEFAETLQVTDSEEEAHALLKRHLERAIPGADATVLNRNNSADRLEAMTELSPDSCLVGTLQHADPRSCLAIRSARLYTHEGRQEPLLGCSVCGECPGRSICTPLTVSGEVIGAVLVSGGKGRSGSDELRINDSVVQAAPVLANLRNLAIAEVRAATDGLTGLPNKRAVGDTLKRMLAQASRSLTPLSLLMIDLDHFKNINDTLGHPVGDQALASVGAALRSVLRAGDFAGRNGGEEFAVLLPDTGVDGASATAEKIRVAIAGIDLPGTGLALTASLGIAVYPVHAVNVERLERLADAALYTAKRTGRNRSEVAVLSDEEDTPQATGTPVGVIAF